MSRYEAIVAIAGIIFGSVSLIGIVWGIAWGAVRSKRAEAELPDSGSMARIEQRLERMEQALDAVAVEVERVSEGQRFTTKLLAEGPETPRAG